MCLSGIFKFFTTTPREVACHVTTCARPFSSRRGPLRDSTEDRRIGLNMNYSIIFTEISFSPETSILLQIIQIIHMTLGIIPESDRKREGSLSVLAPRRQTHVTPTDKNPSDESHPGDLLTYPPFLGKEGDYKVPPKNSLNKT